MTTSPPPDKDALRNAIAKEEAQLTDLEQARQAAQARLDSLNAELASCDAEPATGVRLPVLPPPAAPTTPSEKVALFRQRFRGREDVYPKLWTNAKSGRTGYAPACSNEWVRGVCEKPRIKCGECPNQAFIPVSDQAILDHLQGRHVIGVYPLLADETCWFLAADFDKSSWTEDVAAFRETCRHAGLSVAVERSRSGCGAHVWFFFTAPVAARTARAMGCYLITDTMARRHELSMGSYDRLFPNQDTMPRGGFGNLIALPFQHEPRQRGHTVFLDEQMVPYPDEDQWTALASIPRIDPQTVELIAREATHQGRVVGVRMAEASDDEDFEPWARPPSGRPLAAQITGTLPTSIRAVLGQRLFVEKAGSPPALLNQIKRLAAFQNPEFYKKQRMRLSTATTPRVITCAEDFPEHLALPRGCLVDLEDLLRAYNITLTVDDRRIVGDETTWTFHGALTPIQTQAADALLAHDLGVLVAPPGVGKTVVGASLVARRGRSTLVMVHRRPLLDQWVAQLALFLGIDPKAIGQIGGGRRAPNGRLDVAMIQSLLRKGRVDDLVAGYGHVIVDECHHVPAVSFERVLSEVTARFVTGLTATPHRRDGHHPIAQMQLGPVRFVVDPKHHAARRPFAHRLIVRDTAFHGAGPEPTRGIQALYAQLATDEVRNELILNDVISALHEGRTPIVLTERKDHLDYLATRLRPFTRHLIVLQGGMTGKAREETRTRLATLPDNEERLVLATGRYAGEGFDDARLDTLFLAMPISWKGTLVQYAGRLHRLRAGKTEVRIVDYVDRHVPMLARMFEKRLRGYRAIGYTETERP